MSRLEVFASLARSRRVCGIVGAAAVLSAGCVSAIKPVRREDPPPPPTGPAALSLSALADLHNRVSPERALHVAKAQCIDFFVDQQAELELREKRVRDEVIEALKTFCVDLTTNTAERTARRILERHVGPDVAAERYLAAANAYMRAQRFGAAEGEIREAIRLVPNNAHYYLQLGMARYHQRRCAIAAATFETAIQLDSTRGYVGYGYAGHCFQLGREWEKAHAAYQRAFDHSPSPEWRDWLIDRISELPRRPMTPPLPP